MQIFKIFILKKLCHKFKLIYKIFRKYTDVKIKERGKNETNLETVVQNQFLRIIEQMNTETHFIKKFR